MRKLSDIIYIYIYNFFSSHIKLYCTRDLDFIRSHQNTHNKIKPYDSIILLKRFNFN